MGKKNLTDTIDQLDLTDLYKTSKIIAKYTSSSAHAHRTFIKTDHIWGQKTNFNTFQRIQVIQNITIL